MLMIPIAMVVAVLATLLVVFRVRYSRKQKKLKEDALDSAIEIRNKWDEASKNYKPHVTNRTEFSPGAESIAIGQWPWQKSYRPRIIVRLSNIEDATALKPSLDLAVEEYLAKPSHNGGFRNRPFIDFESKSS